MQTHSIVRSARHVHKHGRVRRIHSTASPRRARVRRLSLALALTLTLTGRRPSDTVRTCATHTYPTEYGDACHG